MDDLLAIIEDGISVNIRVVNTSKGREFHWSARTEEKSVDCSCGFSSAYECMDDLVGNICVDTINRSV